MYGEIRTANVIYTCKGKIFKITSFNGNEEGRRLATLHFSELIRKKDRLLSDKEVENFVMEGEYEVFDYENYTKDYKIHLVYGNVPIDNCR